jgi:hypothetical protein
MRFFSALSMAFSLCSAIGVATKFSRFKFMESN